MKYLVYIILALSLVACGHDKQVLVQPMNIDSAMLKSCDTLDTSEVSSVDDVLRENIDLYGKYAICSRKQDDSIKLIKKLANIKD